MYCSKCGSELKEDSIFCSSCGFSLQKEVRTEEKRGLIGQYFDAIMLSLKWSGRFSRRQLAIILIGNFCSSILLFFILGILMGSLGIIDLESEPLFIIISFIWYIGIIIINIGANVRRFHDLDKSGWNFLFLIIPIINLFFIWILLVEKGKEIGETRWG